MRLVIPQTLCITLMNAFMRLEHQPNLSPAAAHSAMPASLIGRYKMAMPNTDKHLQMAILKYLQTYAEACPDEEQQESLQARRSLNRLRNPAKLLTNLILYHRSPRSA